LDENERRFMRLDELIEKSFHYALEHWKDAIKSVYTHGKASSDEHYCTGCWIDANSHGVTAKFQKRSLTVSITYAEVRRFIERLLSPQTVEDRQMTMLEILSMEVSHV